MINTATHGTNVSNSQNSSKVLKTLDYWHPVLPSNKLKHKPVSVTLCNQEIVLFRTQQGIGALEDRCPHRRMRLSQGWVEGQHLVCPYHGWSYDRTGEAVIPGTSNRRACAKRFEVIERYNMIWIKAFGSPAEFTGFADVTFPHLFTLQRYIHSPLELVVDNFCDQEHTGATHVILGFDRAEIPRLKSQMSLTDSSVKVAVSGLQRAFPRPIGWLLGVRNGDQFVVDWTFYFAPVHALFRYTWIDPLTNIARARKAQLVIFFNSINEQTTEVVLFVFSPPVRFGTVELHLILKPLLRGLVAFELWLDQRMLEKCADKNISIHGMQLGCFDQALRETRQRIQRIYKGQR